MRTTLDIEDTLFTEAKIQAIKQGISLKEFLTRAIQHELEASKAKESETQKPWELLLGSVKLIALEPETTAIDTGWEPDFLSVYEVNEPKL